MYLSQRQLSSKATLALFPEMLFSVVFDLAGFNGLMTPLLNSVAAFTVQWWLVLYAKTAQTTDEWIESGSQIKRMDIIPRTEHLYPHPHPGPKRDRKQHQKRIL